MSELLMCDEMTCEKCGIEWMKPIVHGSRPQKVCMNCLKLQIKALEKMVRTRDRMIEEAQDEVEKAGSYAVELYHQNENLKARLDATVEELEQERNEPSGVEHVAEPELYAALMGAWSRGASDGLEARGQSVRIPRHLCGKYEGQVAVLIETMYSAGVRSMGKTPEKRAWPGVRYQANGDTIGDVREAVGGAA